MPKHDRPVTSADAAPNPLGLPWRCDYEEPRVIRNSSGAMIGSLDTAEAAALAVESANAGDVEARREVSRLREVIEHYRHRMEMSPSSRQHYFDESHEESIQPERYYIDTREKPARTLITALENALADRRHLGGSEEDFHAALTEAIKAFKKTTRRWWG